MKGLFLMFKIRPISDLRNKFSEIEGVISTGELVFLTKNGYGSMVVMSLEKYAEITDDTERLLDEADYAAELPERCSHEEVFSRVRGRLNG